MAVLSALAALAVAIALVGIYGVTAYAVHQREREIAIRSALGAPRRALVQFFVAEAARVVAIGVVGGAIGAFWLGRVLRNQIAGVAPGDPLTLGVAMLGVAAACLLAAWIPGRSAASQDAAVVLRGE